VSDLGIVAPRLSISCLHTLFFRKSFFTALNRAKTLVKSKNHVFTTDDAELMRVIQVDRACAVVHTAA
jgi:hypothetical protein